MPVLDKLDILSIGSLKTTTVQVDGGEIIISELGASDSFSLFTDPDHKDKEGNLLMSTFGPALVARCVMNEQGDRVFEDDEACKIARLKPTLFAKLLTAAMEINGLSEASVADEAKN